MMGRSMLAYIPVNLANVIVSFGTIVVLTRLLDSAEFGRYALAVISLQFVHMGLFTWLEAAMVRFQARAERKGYMPSHLKTIYVYAAFVAFAGWALVMAVLWLLPINDDMKLVLTFALSSGCLSLFLNLGMEAHKADHRIGRYSTLYSGYMLLSFTLGILLIVTTPLRESAPFVGVLISMVLVLVIDLPFMIKRMKGGEVKHKQAKTYFKYGMPICISLFFTYTLSSGDMFLITAIMGESAAGQYNAGYNLANRSLDVLFIWMAMAVTPIAITALEKEGLEKSRLIMRDYASILLLMALPAATGIALVAEPAGFILGESVRSQAVEIMPLIAYAGVLNGMITYYAHRAFMLSNHTHMFLAAMIPPAVLNIGLNLWFIPMWGLMGAVYATVMSYALGFVLAVIIGRRYYPLPLPVRAFVEISLACLIMAGVVLSLPIGEAVPDFVEVLIKAVIGALVYGFVCFVINAANCRETAQKIMAKIAEKRGQRLSEVRANAS